MVTLDHYLDIACPITKSKVSSKAKGNPILKDASLNNLKEFIDMISDIDGNTSYLPMAGSMEELKEIGTNLKKKYHYEQNQSVIRNNRDKIQGAHNPTKMAWNIVNEQRTSKVVKKEEIKLVHNQSNIDDPAQIAGILNEYYINLPKTVSKDSGTRNFEPSYNKCKDSLFLSPVTPDKLLTIIYSLKNKSSAGLDGVSNILLKKIAHNIVIPLAHAINLSLEVGIFPNVLKPSKVVPLFKSGDKLDVKNYRPLTLSSNISKIYEKVYYICLSDFLTKNDIIVNEQFGFQKGKSTNHAIAKAVEHITTSLNNNSKVMGLFIDMSKAFDCVDHTKLLKILENYGIRGTALKWIETYLTDRKQCVELTCSLSPMLKQGHPLSMLSTESPKVPFWD